jgi:hypothetical protein
VGEMSDVSPIQYVWWAPDGRLHRPLAALPVRGEEADDSGGKQALGAGFDYTGRG